MSPESGTLPPTFKCHSALPFYSGKPQIHCVGDTERRQDQSVFKVAKRKQMFVLAGQRFSEFPVKYKLLEGPMGSMP